MTEKTRIGYKRLYFFIYLFYWAGMASLLPYLGLHYKNIGLDGLQIGILGSIPSILFIVSSFLFSRIADSTGSHKTIIQLSIIGLFISALLIEYTKDFALLIFPVILFSISNAPFNPIIDKMAIELLGSHKEQIGNIRIGGSIGWGISVIATGVVLKYFPIRSVFLCYQILILCCFILSFNLPNIKKERICSKSKAVTTIHRSRALILILISVFIWGTGEKCITNYLFLHMDILGTSTFIMGSSMAFAIVGEMLALYCMEKLIRKFGYDKLFFMGFVLQALRLLSLSFFSNSVLILITQLIGGASFSLIWVSSVARVDTLAPDDEKTIAQGLRTGFLNGFGGAFGSLLGGLLFMNFGAQMLYRIMGLLVCFGVILLLLSGKKGNKLWITIK